MQKLIDFLARQPAGYKTSMAESMGRPPTYLSRQLAGDRAFTVADCVAVEKYTHGAVRCEDLLPDIDWAYLRTRRMDVAA